MEIRSKTITEVYKAFNQLGFESRNVRLQKHFMEGFKLDIDDSEQLMTITLDIECLPNIKSPHYQIVFEKVIPKEQIEVNQ